MNEIERRWLIGSKIIDIEETDKATVIYVEKDNLNVCITFNRQTDSITVLSNRSVNDKA